jgi:hypothetical protein
MERRKKEQIKNVVFDLGSLMLRERERERDKN